MPHLLFYLMLCSNNGVAIKPRTYIHGLHCWKSTTNTDGQLQIYSMGQHGMRGRGAQITCANDSTTPGAQSKKKNKKKQWAPVCKKHWQPAFFSPFPSHSATLSPLFTPTLLIVCSLTSWQRTRNVNERRKKNEWSWGRDSHQRMRCGRYGGRRLVGKEMDQTEGFPRKSSVINYIIQKETLFYATL